MREAECGRCGRDRRDDRALHTGIGARRRHVDRLFEERAVERVGLVEDGETARTRRATSIPSMAYSRPGMNSSIRISCSLPVRRARISGRASSAETRANAATQRLRRVDANHAAAARQRHRLDDRGIPRPPRQFDRIGIDGRRNVARGRQAGLRPAARGPAACARSPAPRPADCHGSPSASATRAASTTGRSPTAITPSTGRPLPPDRAATHPRRETHRDAASRQVVERVTRRWQTSARRPRQRHRRTAKLVTGRSRRSARRRAPTRRSPNDRSW